MIQFTEEQLTELDHAFDLIQQYCNEPPHCQALDYCIFRDPTSGVCPIDIYACREAVTYEKTRRQKA